MYNEFDKEEFALDELEDDPKANSFGADDEEEEDDDLDGGLEEGDGEEVVDPALKVDETEEGL